MSGLALWLSVLAPLACGPRQVSPADRQAIERVLNSYAQRMAKAYEDGGAKSLAGIATEREQLRVEHGIQALAAEGKALRPRLQSLTIEDLEPAGQTTVVANTLEVWDLEVVGAESGNQLSEATGQENRLTYSLVREHGRWLVLSRTLRNSQAPS